MLAENFKVQAKSKVSSLIETLYPTISYNTIMKLIRNKDIKVNGKRISKDEIVDIGDEIVFYVNENLLENKIDIIYEDENIAVVFKKRKIETVSPNVNLENVETLLSKQLGQKCYAVHRLDMNTIGLLVFAKNLKAKYLLEESFKNKTIEKFYLALVCSEPPKEYDDMIAYLKKDKENSFVTISDFSQNGYEKIETLYKKLQVFEYFSLIEVKILTGKTHQIRAHFAHIGYPVLGDEKYGNFEMNKKYKLKYQCLCSYKLIFHFEKNNLLSYLDGRVVELDKNKIDFLEFCK